MKTHCDKCKEPLERRETTSGVETTYSWDNEQHDWIQVDEDFFGDTEVVLRCPECDIEIDISEGEE